MNASSAVCFTVNECKSLPHDASYERHIMDFEKNFDSCFTLAWALEHWKLVYLAIAIYLLAIFFGQRYMKSHPPFQLQGALLAWNAALATISIFGAWRAGGAVLYQIQHVGFHATLCGGGSAQFQQAIGLYLFSSGWCKVLELGDTAFIVLRKKPLIFLHWFHHASVCLFTASSCCYPSGIYLFFLAINLSVHSFIYSYFTLKLLKFRIPLAVNIAITFVQLMEMLLGVSITLYSYRMKKMPGVGCCVHGEAIAFATSIYLAYFVLFLNFFVRSYFFNQPLPAVLAKKRV